MAKLKVVPPSIRDLIDKDTPLPQPTTPPIATLTDLPPAFLVPWDTIASTISTPPEKIDFTISDTKTPPTVPDVPVVTFIEPAPHASIPPAPPVTRSGRTSRTPSRFLDYALAALFTHTNISSPNASPSTFLLQPHDSIFSKPHPMALLSQHMLAMITTDPDTMNLKEALNDSDRDQFIEAMGKELSDHVTCKHWKVVSLKDVSKTKTYQSMPFQMTVALKATTFTNDRQSMPLQTTVAMISISF